MSDRNWNKTKNKQPDSNEYLSVNQLLYHFGKKKSLEFNNRHFDIDKVLGKLKYLQDILNKSNGDRDILLNLKKSVGLFVHQLKTHNIVCSDIQSPAIRAFAMSQNIDETTLVKKEDIIELIFSQIYIIQKSVDELYENKIDMAAKKRGQNIASDILDIRNLLNNYQFDSSFDSNTATLIMRKISSNKRFLAQENCYIGDAKLSILKNQLNEMEDMLVKARLQSPPKTSKVEKLVVDDVRDQITKLENLINKNYQDQFEILPSILKKYSSLKKLLTNSASSEIDYELVVRYQEITKSVHDMVIEKNQKKYEEDYAAFLEVRTVADRKVFENRIISRKASFTKSRLVWTEIDDVFEDLITRYENLKKSLLKQF
jgi:hypothetical protein